MLHVQSLPELNAILHFKDTQLFLQYDQLLKAVDSFTSGSTKKIETSPQHGTRLTEKWRTWVY